MSTSDNIYDDGDLTLIVGSEKKRFKVSKVALCLASPAWKAMISGRFAEGSADEIDLPADQPAALRILLLQAHLQFARLPTQVTIEVAADIAELCEKYDLLAMARDRLLEWVDALKPSLSKIPKEEQAALRWARCKIWIGWTLMRWGDFQVGMKVLMRQASPVTLSTMADLPPGCSAFLLDGVKPTIQAMLDATYAEFEAASSARWGRCQTIRTISSAKMCHSIHLGMVTRFMFKTLLPVAGNQKPDALSVSMSLKQMEEAFDDIRVDEFRNTDICIGEFSHKSCYTDWFRVRDLLSSFNNMRAPMIHDHFEARFF